MAVGTRGASKDHPAHLRLVARVPDHGTELGDPVGELAVGPVRTRAALLPLVAQLRLEHPLVVYIQLQRLLILVPLPRHIYLLRSGGELTRATWPSEGETWTWNAVASGRREVMCLGEASGADGDALWEREPVGGKPIEAVGGGGGGGRSAFFVDGEATKVVEERSVGIGRGGEEAVVEGGLRGEELEELGVGDAELSVLLTEGVGLADEVEEASAAEVVVAV